MSAPYRHFDDMCWPVPCERLTEIHYGLVHAEPVREGVLVACSVLGAYAELIRLPAKKRDAIIRELRKGPGIVRQGCGAQGSEKV